MQSLLAILSFLLLSFSGLTMSYRLAARMLRKVVVSSPCTVQRAIAPFPIQRSFLTSSKPILAPLSAESGGAVGGDTVVARCTEKIASALKPVNLKVTSSNDDPNGSHVIFSFENYTDMFKWSIYCFRSKSFVYQPNLKVRISFKDND